MTVNAISGSAVAAPTAALQRNPEAAEVGPDHDGDADDRSVVRSTVNASGQKLGQIVNVKA